MFQRKMTVLEMYAQHGSCSYGEIGAERLRSILQGEHPSSAERARFGQAMLETPAYIAPELAAEISMTVAAIEQRTIKICQELPGSHCIG